MNSHGLITSLAGHALRAAGPLDFKGKGRLVYHWLRHRNPRYVGSRALDGGGKIICRFDVPYEAMVWARQEEECELRALRTLLSPGDRFVDCGANVGLWSLVAAGRVGASGHVTAFERNPSAYERLVRNISASGAVGERITVLNLAVAETPGVVTFEPGAQHNLGRICAAGPEGQACIQVPAVSLDERLGASPIRAIKLDIEGGEAAALRGASRILATQRPWIWAEFNVAANGTDRIGEWELFALLGGYGYTCRRIATPAGAVPGPAMSPDERFSGYVNVIFQPADA